MKKSFFKYLAVLVLLGLVTVILVSSRKADNTNNTSNTSNTSNTDSNLDSTGTKDNLSPVQAEQTGSSPESGATSRLKQVHDWLVAKSDPDYGGTQPSDWSFDFGTYWNRILYSAFWEPDGTATESDVRVGITFFSGSNNRVQKIGTAGRDFSPEQYVQYDDAHASDYTGEESTWTNTNALSGSEVWYDTRTGLYWSKSLGNYTNSFSSPSTGYCDFYTSTPRGSYNGSDADCGNAINACGTLSLSSTQGQSAKTDWYLPSQKELKQAYRDGMYNQTTTAFTTTSYFWSSTESSGDSTYAWIEYLDYGNAFNFNKLSSSAVRCVRRD